MAEKGDSAAAGTVALVTGAALRLGAAISRRLAAGGADLVLHCRASREAAEELAAEVRAAGRRAWVLAADLDDPAMAEALLPRAAEAAGGPVTVLVNNASIFPRDRVTDFTLADLEHNLRVNTWAPLVLSRALAAQGEPGVVVNLLDCRIHDYDEEHAAYHLSKRMLFSLTRMTALEFAPRVRVNAVAPGLILPPPGEDESFLERMAHTNPLHAHGSPGEVAAAVDYLVRAPFVTGQVIHVDGGRHMRGRVYG
jgi:hypothetical protein